MKDLGVLPTPTAIPTVMSSINPGQRKRRSRFRFQREVFPGHASWERNQNRNGHSNPIESMTSCHLEDVDQQPPICGVHEVPEAGIESVEDLQGSSEEEGIEKGDEAFAEEPLPREQEHGEDQCTEDFVLRNSDNFQALFGGDCEALGAENALKFANWRVLLGLILTNGSRKVTKHQYQAIRMIADAFQRLKSGGAPAWKGSGGNDAQIDLEKRKIRCLPHNSTLATKFSSALFDSLCVRAQDTVEAVDLSKAGARAKYYTETGVPQVPVRTVLPSEYARADVASVGVFELMKSTALHAGDSPGDLQDVRALNPDVCDAWPLVAAREFFYGSSCWISVDFEGWKPDYRGSSFAETGDVVQIALLGSPELCAGISGPFKVGMTDDGYANLRGEISAVWTVHHTSKRGNPEFEPSFHVDVPERDRMLALHFSFADYTSPSDSVNVDVPELPVESANEDELSADIDEAVHHRKKRKLSPAMAEALRLRREAIRRRKKEMENAWLGWEKPLVKPSDVLCLIRPCRQSGTEEARLHEDQTGARLVIVHRFWTESEERERHVFCIPSDSTVVPARMDDESPNCYRELVRCSLWEPHDGKRGPDRFHPTSSMGKLASGELYFVYRFLLFWDGFEVTKGNSASGDGFYMVPLNLPSYARSNSNAVRIISLSPPGVKSSSVFKRIQEDIIKGATEGFQDIDATGRRRRIFLDLVGFLGDTPALNSTLDTLGHTAAACCHLCKFRRHKASLCGSRYTDLRHHGMKSASCRGYYQIRAVRDSGATNETCRLLGLANSHLDEDMPLHNLRRALFSVRSRIPKTANGVPVVSGLIDPYKSCFVAPDHLLTGHLRDCLNFAIKLLPSKEYRSMCEAYIVGYLRDCQLPLQNRLFDKEKKPSTQCQ